MPEEEKEAFLIGSAVDLLMQGEDVFSSKYLPVARRDAKTAEANPNKTLLTLSQMETVTDCMNEFKRQPLFKEGGEKQVEIIVDYKGYKLKATMDKFFKDEATIRDTKTAASIDALNRFLDGYLNQFSFYQWVTELKLGIVCEGEMEVVTKETPNRGSSGVTTPLTPGTAATCARASSRASARPA